MRTPFIAQLRAELIMTLRRGESVLLTLGIPVLLLVFFSLVDVLPTGTDKSVDFLAPSTLALAVLSMAMVGTAIATAFEREYGVLKRLGTTPLGRPRLLGAKVVSILVVEVLQIVVLTLVAAALGWRPPLSGLGPAALAAILGTVAFAGIGLLMAGTLRATVVLAGANGLYLVLLLISGIIVPLVKLPQVVRWVAELLPSSALSDIMHGSLMDGGTVTGRAWLVLVVWAVAAPLAAMKWFRWE